LKKQRQQRNTANHRTLGRNSLEEEFVWILADEKERQSVLTPNSPGTRYGRSSNTQFRGRGFAERKHRPLIRIGSL
jgi:hypothetical protein